jgi:FkbM family methyltransferase
MIALRQLASQVTDKVIDFEMLARRSRAARALRPLLRLIPEHAVVPVLQGPLRGTRWIRGSSVNACWLGSYEHEKQIAFADALSPGDVVFDLGANVGLYTLLAAKCVGPRGHVYAFEPLPHNVRFLERHLRLNRVSNATVLELAISDHSGRSRLDDTAHPSEAKLSSSGRVEVEVDTLDNLVASGEVRPPQCLKIDVEGAESAVLEGAREVLQQHSPVVFLATHGSEQHRTANSMLESLGYSVAGVADTPVDATDELVAHPRAPVHGQS